MTDPLHPATAPDRLALRLKGVTARRVGAALALWGEAGVGKTYTVQGLLRALPCRTFSLHATLPLAAWVEVLPEGPKLPHWAARLSARLARAEHLGVDEIGQTLGARLRALAPCVLHVEDVHEVLPEGLELLLALARTVPRSRGVALLVTSRVGLAEPFESFRLEPLSPEGAEDLLQREVGAALPQDALGWVYARAAGNPLFTLEYFRLLSRQGFLWNDGRRWHWRTPASGLMPVTVEALIEQGLNGAVQLPDLGAALQSKAMLPVDASDALWAEVADLSASALAAAKLELARRGLFHGGTFVHPLYREVTLQGLPPPRRRELSRRALTAFRDDPQTAAGFVADAEPLPEEAVRLLKRAAASARELGDGARAAQLLAQAAACAPGAEKVELALEAARCGLDAGDAGVAPLLESALPHLEDPTSALLMLAEACALQGRRAEMGAVLTRLPRAVRESPDWLNRYLKLLFMASDFSQLVRVWEGHPRFQSEADPATVYRVAYALVDLGRLESARALVRSTLAREGLTAEDKAGLLDICAAIAFYGGDSVEAEGFFSEALALYRRAGSWDGVANTLRNRALNRLQMGRYRESLPSFAEALKLYAERGRGIHYAQTLVMLGDPYIELGEYERAEEVLSEALEVFERTEPQPFLVTNLANLAALYTDWAPPHGWLLAQKYGERCLRVARDLGAPPYVAIAAVVASRAATFAGDPARGLELAEEARDVARAISFQETLAKAELARASALAGFGRASEALLALRDGASVAEAHQNVLDAQRIGLERDHLTGDVESARERLGWFEGHGLMNGANLARRYFPELAGRASLPQTAEPARLEVLGPMRIVRDGRATGVRGEKRRQLLALLLEARIGGRGEVGQLALLDALYPGEPEDASTTALRQLVFQLRRGLGDGVVVRTSGGYALGAHGSDAEAFLKGGDTRLWRGAYLEGTTPVDETVRDALYHALKARLTELVAHDPAEAARVGRILMDAEPYDAEVLRVTMWALGDNPRAAEKLYREGRGRLLEVGERLPESWRSFLEPKTP